MSALIDIAPTIAGLRVLASLSRDLAFAAEDVTIESASLRLLSDLLLDLVNELEMIVRDALNPPVAKATERQVALALAKAERSPPDSSGRREPGQRALVASRAKLIGRQAKKRSALSAVPIVIMAANLGESWA
jgi:hypothetical protein